MVLKKPTELWKKCDKYGEKGFYVCADISAGLSDISLALVQLSSVFIMIVAFMFQWSDNYYRAELIDALALTVTPAVTTVTITGWAKHFLAFTWVVLAKIEELRPW